MLKLQNKSFKELIKNSHQKIRGSRHIIYKINLNNKFYCIRKIDLKKNDINYFNRNFSIKNEFFFIKLFYNQKINISKAYIFKNNFIITDFINGSLLSDKIRNNNLNQNIILYKKLFLLIKKIQNININKFLTLKYKKEYKIKFFEYLFKRINSKIFKKYFINHKVLRDYINKNYLNVNFSNFVPVVYDLHAENIIVKDRSKLYLFDLDYCHFAPPELEFISIFLDIFARYNYSEFQYLKKLFISQYEKNNNKFNYELEKLFAINHYVIAIIKHHYKQQNEAKSKIKIYKKELERLIDKNELRYPQITWKVRKLYSTTLSKKK